MSAMLAVVFFEVSFDEFESFLRAGDFSLVFKLIEPSYHNYRNNNPPEQPLCSYPDDHEFESTPFLIIAIMAYGAFALFFNVDKIMTLILSYNEPTESEQASSGKGFNNILGFVKSLL